MLKKSDLERLKMRSIKDDRSDCLNWAGSLSQRGYPYISINKKTRYAHRVLWEHEYGALDSTKAVSRRCKNKKCLNIKHFYTSIKSNQDPFGDWNRQRNR